MDLREWTEQYLARNAAIKQWEVHAHEDAYLVTTRKGTLTYSVQETLSSFADDMVIVTLNTKKNIAWLCDHFPNKRCRIIFLHPPSDTYWTLNCAFINTHSHPDKLAKGIKNHVGDVPYA